MLRSQLFNKASTTTPLPSLRILTIYRSRHHPCAMVRSRQSMLTVPTSRSLYKTLVEMSPINEVVARRKII